MGPVLSYEFTDAASVSSSQERPVKAVFEAVGRKLMADQFRRSQTSTRLLQVLAANGHLTPDEADDVRGLAEKRNALVHGELQIEVTQKELERFLSILASLLNVVPA